MRTLRIAAPTQLALLRPSEPGAKRWETLPEPTRVAVLSLLARLIAKGVLAGDRRGGDG